MAAQTTVETPCSWEFLRFFLPSDLQKELMQFLLGVDRDVELGVVKCYSSPNEVAEHDFLVFFVERRSFVGPPQLNHPDQLTVRPKKWLEKGGLHSLLVKNFKSHKIKLIRKLFLYDCNRYKYLVEGLIRGKGGLGEPSVDLCRCLSLREEAFEF